MLLHTAIVRFQSESTQNFYYREILKENINELTKKNLSFQTLKGIKEIY